MQLPDSLAEKLQHVCRVVREVRTEMEAKPLHLGALFTNMCARVGDLLTSRASTTHKGQVSCGSLLSFHSSCC
jgi:hypothetical protein